MKTKLFALFAGVVLVCPAFIPTARAQDSWTNKVRGNFYKWEDGSKWSLGAPPSGSSTSVFITNNPTGGTGSGQTVNIDATTVLSNAINGCMTIHSLTLSTPSGVNHNLLAVNNTGSSSLNFDTPNHLQAPELDIELRCTVSITNSTVFVSPLGGGRIFDNGILILNSGTLNASVELGTNGQMTVFDGSVAGNFFFGEVDEITGSCGTLTVNGGSVSWDSIGCQAWLNGGTLTSFEDLDIDNLGAFGAGAGILTVSNGVCQPTLLFVGELNSGTLNIAGGSTIIGTQSTNTFFTSPSLAMGVTNGTHGWIWMTGGQLTIEPTTYGTNAAIIGFGGTGQMTVSNGMWTSDSMLLGNGAEANTFAVFSGPTFGGAGSLTINGGTGSVYSNLIVGSDDCAGTGFVTIAGGSLAVTNVSHTGVLIVHNGTLLLSSGTLNTDQALMTNFCVGSLLIAGSGSVWSNGDVFVGSLGSVVSLVVSNGAQVINTHDLNLGFNAGVLPSFVTVTGSGTVWSNEFEMSAGNFGAGNVVSINSGAHMFTVNASLGDNGVASTNNGVVVADAGSVWSTFVLDVGFNGSGNSVVVSNGGSLLSTFTVLGSSPGANNNSVLVSDAGSTWSNGASIVIGNSGAGATVTVTNGGVTLARNMVIGEQSGGGGQLTVVAGGTALVSSNVTLGNYSCSGTGNVVVTGGSLYVTNGVHGAVLEVRSGTFILNSGTVVVDQFVITNACAHFIRSGGTLLYGSAILSSNLDADGDGIPNGYELAHGLDPLNPADAAQDNDGDGFSNLQEYLAGTDPNNAASTPFIATAVARQANNIVLTWTTLGGTTNQVQVANGNFATNGFVNLGAPLNIGGVGLVTTNYTDINGATNAPSRYFRVRLVP